MRLRPEIQEFITEKVRSGHFPSAEAVVEDALLRMMDEEIVLTEQDIRAIEESEKEIDRGEYIDFDTFAADMRKRYGVHK